MDLSCAATGSSITLKNSDRGNRVVLKLQEPFHTTHQKTGRVGSQVFHNSTQAFTVLVTDLTEFLNFIQTTLGQEISFDSSHQLYPGANSIGVIIDYTIIEKKDNCSYIVNLDVAIEGG